MIRQCSVNVALFAVMACLLGQASAFSLQMNAAVKTAVIAGATGYIGKSTVRESVRQGYKTIALVRDKSKVESKEGGMLYGQFFEGAEVVECDVTDPEKLTKVRKNGPMRCTISIPENKPPTFVARFLRKSQREMARLRRSFHVSRRARGLRKMPTQLTIKRRKIAWMRAVPPMPGISCF